MMHHYTCVVLMHRSSSSTLFPYTTLFRSAVGNPATDYTLRTNWSAAGTGAPCYSANTNANIQYTPGGGLQSTPRSEEHTSELKPLTKFVCRLVHLKAN